MRINYFSIVTLLLSLSIFNGIAQAQDYSTAHQKYMNKVTFSSESAEEGDTSGTHYKTEFNGSEQIHLNFYWDKPVSDYKIRSLWSWGSGQKYEGSPEKNPYNEYGEFLIEFVLIDEANETSSSKTDEEKADKSKTGKKKFRLVEKLEKFLEENSSSSSSGLARPEARIHNHKRLLQVSLDKENAKI